MTFEQAFHRICAKPTWNWCAAWFRLKCIIVQAGGRSWEAKSPDAECPRDVDALGCTGESVTSRLDWIGYDLDVGHGKNAYLDTETALDDARRLRERLDGQLEIRLSKSGAGVHCRHMLPFSSGLKFADAKAKALELTKGMMIRLDATPLGRQAFWLWARPPGPDGFKLIEPHKGM